MLYEVITPVKDVEGAMVAGQLVEVQRETGDERSNGNRKYCDGQQGKAPAKLPPSQKEESGGDEQGHAKVIGGHHRQSRQSPKVSRESITALAEQAATAGSVITSYSIHYTKLYELGTRLVW